MKSFLILFLLLILNGFVFAGEVENKNDRSIRELSMAENAIFSSLIVASSKNGRYLCTQTPLACLGPNGAELGLALIASKNSEESVKRFASLLRYRIDASIAEDYDCYSLEKGKTLLTYFKELKPEELALQCKDELLHTKTVHKGMIEDLDFQAVCTEKNTISNKVKSLIEAIESGRKCNRGDF